MSTYSELNTALQTATIKAATLESERQIAAIAYATAQEDLAKAQRDLDFYKTEMNRLTARLAEYESPVRLRHEHRTPDIWPKEKDKVVQSLDADKLKNLRDEIEVRLGSPDSEIAEGLNPVTFRVFLQEVLEVLDSHEQQRIRLVQLINRQSVYDL